MIKWLVAYKCDHRSHIKQVIISCEFCQHFNCLEVVLGSWMSLWHLNILGTWIEVLNQFENLLFKKKIDLKILWNNSDTVLLGKYI